MPFQIPLSGINAALTGLRTTANNIANVATPEFRQSRAEFSELSIDGAGRGVEVSRVAEQDTQGGVDLAEQLLDMIRYAQQIKAQAAVVRTESENTDAIANLIGNRDSE